MFEMPPAKKSLGQHWLEDGEALQAMVDAANVQTGDYILEIGPGYGSLTAQLLARGSQLTALEFDAALVPLLLKRFAQENRLQVEQGDIRTYDFTQLPPDYKIVANIPYYLTSNLVQLISETPNPPSMAVLLMQKEVAQRAAAQPGDMSILSVTAQFYWQVSLGQIVPAALFSPPPKVDSQILILQRQAALPAVNPTLFFRLVKAGFSQKRKTMLNSLSGGLAISRERAEQLLRQAHIDAGRRAQMLSLGEWQDLYLVYQASFSVQ